MIELPFPQFIKTKSLFRNLDFHLAIEVILNGSVQARLFTDNACDPQAALIWHQRRLYLAGTAHIPEFNQALQQFFIETICPQMLQAGWVLSTIYYDPPGWENQFGMILRDYRTTQALRHYYTFRELRCDWRTMLPEGFNVRNVDASLLEQGQLKNLELLKGEMCSERSSLAEFLAQSFGVCLVHEGEIVGWCLSEYNQADCCEIGIEVLRPYQKRGFATLLASALIEQARSSGVINIGWHCYADNLPSVATALKIGFQKERDYPATLFRPA